MSTSEINIKIELDEDRIPSRIEWMATAAGQTHPSESKSVFLSFLEKESLDTSTLFLWTQECQVAEMDRNLYYSLTALADGYFRATENTELANEMRSFVQHFGVKTGIIKESTES